jgi:RHH-type proline utilization regulon transcriptional repressor/proline dehydrogenase/delta 1-pyrroline-5-carboxylate dehydrogenase
MRFTGQSAAKPRSIEGLNRRYLADEQLLVRELLDEADPGHAARGKIRETAAELVTTVRRNRSKEGGLEARWKDHLGESDSLFVNASTWGLMLTGQLLQLDESVRRNPAQMLGRLASRAGEPVVRTAMRQAMRIMGHQFVMGRTIGEALARSAKKEHRSYRYSYDMLGEAALTAKDAERYFDAYHAAIGEIGNAPRGDDDSIFSAPSISVKLSALHPRYEFMQVERVLRELIPRLLELAQHAKRADIALTVDAEEADRLELSLRVFEGVLADSSLDGYDGFGLAVQTYQRRAESVFDHLVSLARDVGRRIPVRLVKGAYWDTEIKHAQELGHDSYPVFTRKVHTDVSYLACARRALAAGDALYPQFATHNAHTLASVIHYAGSRRDYEFQRLHGMGRELYSEVINPKKFNRPCRVYAPVGSHEDLLPYLVRRLLENGANTSFVNRIIDESVDVAEIVADPISGTRDHDAAPHPLIASPEKLFGDGRRNSRGFNLADDAVMRRLLADMEAAIKKPLVAHPIINGKRMEGTRVPSLDPADVTTEVGSCILAAPEHVTAALIASNAHQGAWDRIPADDRGVILERAADLYESNGPELLGLCIAEAGKSLPDAIAELREAVDFL